MLVVEEVVVINALPAVVFARLAARQFCAHRLAGPLLPEGGALAEGAIGRLGPGGAGWLGRLRVRFTRVVPGREIRLRPVSRLWGRLLPEAVLTLEPLAGRCRLRTRLFIGLGRLMGPARAALGRRLHRHALHLKHALETTQAPP